jgi:hypothetical protein
MGSRLVVEGIRLGPMRISARYDDGGHHSEHYGQHLRCVSTPACTCLEPVCYADSDVSTNVKGPLSRSAAHGLPQGDPQDPAAANATRQCRIKLPIG